MKHVVADHTEKKNLQVTSECLYMALGVEQILVREGSSSQGLPLTFQDPDSEPASAAW